ncbi:MAG TPA: hypothetical protein EYP10_04185 [Armatimonadetes bacterium]|nr:hypothetical protein [Armatimonadota bacterium]
MIGICFVHAVEFPNGAKLILENELYNVAGANAYYGIAFSQVTALSDGGRRLSNCGSGLRP